MSRFLLALACLAAVSIPAGATSDADWKAIQKALDGIQSNANMSVGKRIQKCGIVVLKDKSSIATSDKARPDFDAKPGDTVLQITIQLPAYDKGKPPQEPTLAVWTIHKNGKPEPLSNWAQALQNRTVPVGYDTWMNC